MALILTIGVVALMLAVRLLIPPVPDLLKTSIDRFGKRSTITLCAVAIVGATVLILITRH
jgi:hypothetical protein